MMKSVSKKNIPLNLKMHLSLVLSAFNGLETNNVFFTIYNLQFYKNGDG